MTLALQQGEKESVAMALALHATPEQRQDFYAHLEQQDPRLLRELHYNWQFWGRPDQLHPTLGPGFGVLEEALRTAWRVWLILAGRGFGKTRTGAEWIIDRIKSGSKRIALCGRTYADVAEVMVHGESGIIARCPPGMKPYWRANKGVLEWQKYRARAKVYTAEKPDGPRGHQHDTVWADELAAWQHPEATWDNLMLGLRLGDDPQALVTTTPRPIPVLIGNMKKKLRDGEARRIGIIAEPRTAISRGSSYENKANLPPEYTQQILGMYEGTRIGRQELYAEILDDAAGALWKRDMIEDARVQVMPLDNEITRSGMGVDPAVTATATSDEHGIITGVKAWCHCKGQREEHLFVFHDASGIYTPNECSDEINKWARALRIDRVIVEINNGGDWIEALLRSHPLGMHLPITKVRASRGKQTRAEPIAALYEQRKVHHVGQLGALEDEMCQWIPGQGDSPNRVDALTWLASELMLGEAVADMPDYDIVLPGPRM